MAPCPVCKIKMTQRSNQPAHNRKCAKFGGQVDLRSSAFKKAKQENVPDHEIYNYIQAQNTNITNLTDNIITSTFNDNSVNNSNNINIHITQSADWRTPDLQMLGQIIKDIMDKRDSSNCDNFQKAFKDIYFNKDHPKNHGLIGLLDKSKPQGKLKFMENGALIARENTDAAYNMILQELNGFIEEYDYSAIQNMSNEEMQMVMWDISRKTMLSHFQKDIGAAKETLHPVLIEPVSNTDSDAEAKRNKAEIFRQGVRAAIRSMQHPSITGEDLEKAIETQCKIFLGERD